MRRFFGALLLGGAWWMGGAAWAANALDQQLGAGSELIGFLPDSYEAAYLASYVWTKTPESNAGQGVFRFSKRADGSGLDFSFDSGYMSTTGNLDRRLRIRTVEVAYDPAKCPVLVKTYKYDRRTIAANAAGDQLEIKYFLGGRLTRTQNLKYSPNLISFDTASIVFQALLAKGISQFGFDLMDNTDGQVYPAQAELQAAATIQDLRKTYPQLPEAFAAKYRDVALKQTLTVRLDGFVAIFFPHRFHSAYDPETRRFLGFWGNDPAVGEYQILE
jgi:hypothetical protein